MNDPQQSWNQPGPPGWAPQQWGPPPGPSPWRPPAEPAAGGSTLLLVLGLVTASLGLVATFLPTFTYGDDGSYSPLVQQVAGASFFTAAGLALPVAVVVLVVGALVQRPRARVGTGLLLVGSGMLADVGLVQVFSRIQVSIDRVGSGTTVAVGGVLLMLAAATALATVIVGLVRLVRLTRPARTS